MLTPRQNSKAKAGVCVYTAVIWICKQVVIGTDGTSGLLFRALHDSDGVGSRKLVGRYMEQLRDGIRAVAL